MAVKSYNIKTNFSALGNGQTATTNCTIGIGGTTLTVGSSLFVAGDVNKYISIPGAGAGTDPLVAKITAQAGTSVTLDTAATQAISSSKLIEWGTDDAQAFEDFNVAARAWQLANPSDTIELTIPAGRYIFKSSPGVGAIFGGIRNLTVIGADAATTFLTPFITAAFSLGAQSAFYPTNNPPSGLPGSRVSTVSAGASSVTLLTPSEHSRFSVGDVVLMSGIDLQGSGQPQNFQFFEYVTVTGKSGGSNENISFTPPLAYDYKSTWPLYQIGNHLEPDLGGPATLFPPTVDWQNTISEFRDLTVNALYRQVLYKARSATLLRVNALGSLGIIASQQAIFNWTDSNALSESMEVDKLCGTVNFNNLTIAIIGFQSPGITHFNCNDCTITTSMGGTALNTTLTDCTLTNLRLGAINYGASLSVTIDGGTITNFDAFGGTPIASNLLVFYEMDDGVIHLDTTEAPAGITGIPAWPMPGSLLVWQSGYNSERSFQVVDIAEVGTNLNDVTTTWPNGFPLPQTGDLSARVHPAPNLSCTGVTGHADFGVLNLAGAQNKPIWSYFRRIYTTLNGNDPNPFMLWGNIVSITVDVTTPTSGAVTLRVTGAYNNYPTIMSDQSMETYGPEINLQQAGTRVITPSGVTFNGSPGSGTGDSNLTLPEPSTWFTGVIAPYTTADMTGGSVTIEIITDQGLEAVEEEAAPSLQRRPRIRLR